MNNNDDVFLKQMKGVRPIKKNNKVKKEETKINFKNIQKLKKKLITTPVSHNEKVFKNSEFRLEKIDIKKNIKKKSLNINKKIDFHGKTLLEAEEIFNKVILECYNNEQRCLLFVTGKGLFKPNNNQSNKKPKLYHGVIRTAFIQWAKSNKFSKEILSVEQASIDHGGDGAFYVYLRKKKN